MKNFRLTAAVSAILLSGGSFSPAQASEVGRHVPGHVALASVTDAIDSLRSQIGSRLVLVGRVDEVRSDVGIVVLGQLVELGTSTSVSVGDYVGVIGEPAKDGRVSADTIVAFGSPYVAGSSIVSLVGTVDRNSSALGRADVGSVSIDYTQAMGGIDFSTPVGDQLVEFRGIQPTERGIVLAERLLRPGDSVQVASSRGGVTTDGSLGTGRAVSLDGSLGTGRAGTLNKVSTDGSLGTGRAVSLDGSLGTGRAGTLNKVSTDGSLGTGRAVSLDGSLGTGRAGTLSKVSTDGSLGTGRAVSLDGSLGTGRAVSID